VGITWVLLHLQWHRDLQSSRVSTRVQPFTMRHLMSLDTTLMQLQELAWRPGSSLYARLAEALGCTNLAFDPCAFQHCCSFSVPFQNSSLANVAEAATLRLGAPQHELSLLPRCVGACHQRFEDMCRALGSRLSQHAHTLSRI
jgi:hypothetical protein